MASTTTFMSFTLPALNEFVDAWNEPLNQNFEDLDDWLKDLHDSLVSSSTSGTWSSLRGSKSSLAARLDVSINADGTLDVSGSADILAMATSNIRGQFSNPRDRLNDGDEEIYEARQPVADGRFAPMPAAGPSAGFPPESIDAGIAVRSADFGASTSFPISGPRKPWSPGLVTGGANPLISALAIGRVRISADTIPAIFNIDGYVFRIREIVDFDWNLLTPGDNDYVWIYVERVEAGYGGANFRYDGPGGSGVATKDLRKLQSGTAGVTSGSTFTDAAALFNTIALGKVKEGDVLVVESGIAAGDYVIDQLDGTTPDTKLTIKGVFKANVSGITWHIRDNPHPNIGAVVTDADPATLPAYADGRVYIGRAKHRTGSNPEEVITFAKNGVYDSGWGSVDASADFPKTLTHNLGAVPTKVEIWMRLSAVDRIYQPVVERQVVTNVDTANFPNPLAGDVKLATMLLPSVRAHSSEVDITVMLLNASTDPAKPSALFTDSGGTDRAVGQMRVIARL